jgi:hypothetical protein
MRLSEALWSKGLIKIEMEGNKLSRTRILQNYYTRK